MAGTIIGVALLPPLASATVEFSSLLTGGAVLQRNTAVTVWGTSSHAEGALIDLAVDGVSLAQALTGADGSWKTWLPPQPATWHAWLTATHSGSGDSATAPVRFGEVVFCSGQSNMQMPVGPNKEGAFSDVNGTAEAAAAGRYTDKISILAPLTPFPVPSSPPWNGTNCFHMEHPSQCHPQWQQVSPGPNGTLRGFSALCWYTGKSIFERLGATVPVGLLSASMGGSPIEAWIPAGSVQQCDAAEPPCDLQGDVTIGGFYNSYVTPCAPYTLGAVVWDQGERDVHCFAPGTNKTAEYPCMERELIRVWRELFNSSFSFVAVQLPGYLGDCDSTGPNPNATYSNCVPGVFNMRLAQEEGVKNDDQADIVPTYDLGCPFGVQTDECPFGSVHNNDKREIGDRTALKIMALRGLLPEHTVSGGPAAVSAIATEHSDRISISITFDEGGLFVSGTNFCASCCGGIGDGDFDVTFDKGLTWTNGTAAWDLNMDTVTFAVPGSGAPTHVRYTGNQGFPQCAIRNAAGFPALPFLMQVTSLDSVQV